MDGVPASGGDLPVEQEQPVLGGEVHHLRDQHGGGGGQGPGQRRAGPVHGGREGLLARRLHERRPPGSGQLPRRPAQGGQLDPAAREPFGQPREPVVGRLQQPQPERPGHPCGGVRATAPVHGPAGQFTEAGAEGPDGHPPARGGLGEQPGRGGRPGRYQEHLVRHPAMVRRPAVRPLIMHRDGCASPLEGWLGEDPRRGAGCRGTPGRCAKSGGAAPPGGRRAVGR